MSVVQNNTISTNSITEATSANGVTIDGVSLKDSFVTQSALPFFRAYGTGDSTTVTNGSRLPLNQTETNQGSYYSTSGYYFLTPVTGVYLITLQYYSFNIDGTTFRYTLYASDNDSSFSNPSSLGRMRVDGTSSAKESDYMYSQCIKITTNKRVYWQNSQGSDATHYQATTEQTTFTGTLIG